MEKTIRQVLVRSGKNKGKIAGLIVKNEDGDFYYKVIKNVRNSTAWIKSKYYEYICLSEDIIQKDLNPQKITKIQVMFITGTEKTFFVTIPINDFTNNGRLFTFDDRQVCLQWTRYPKQYKTQNTLKKW